MTSVEEKIVLKGYHKLTGYSIMLYSPSLLPGVISMTVPFTCAKFNHSVYLKLN